MNSINRYVLTAIFITLILTSCSSHLSSSQKNKAKWTEESIKKYFDENKEKLDPIEGIYSVSKNTERGIGKLSFSQKKSDFARVAIIRNTEGFTPEFNEFILEGLELPKYSKTAEFTRIQKSSAYLSKRLAPDAGASYSFAYDEAAGSMEGILKGSINTKVLYYLKVYPSK
ncbi:MAG TPA: hypothetical protein VGQ59_12425 [Cyclobacteriaceae bacterium]|jgi:hypothetical protein|nr:hypothetical protein [Cyclobacteriaceae bacterium]